MTPRTDIVLAVLATLELVGISACELTSPKVADSLEYEESQRQLATIQLSKHTTR